MNAHSSPASRATPFSYICRRCSRCCHDKRIQLDPYEVARLARAMGESTSRFRTAWTVDGQGVALRQKEDGACVFLGAKGCEVHPDRPLVCRVYPLGRHLRNDGLESYSRLEGHPQSEGEFGRSGTVTDYLEAQGAAPFIAASDGYFRWFLAASERLGVPAAALFLEARGVSDDLDLLDIDSMIARHCAATGEPEPDDVDGRQKLHLRLLYDAIADLEVKDEEENSELGKPAA